MNVETMVVKLKDVPNARAMQIAKTDFDPEKHTKVRPVEKGNAKGDDTGNDKGHDKKSEAPKK